MARAPRRSVLRRSSLATLALALAAPCVASGVACSSQNKANYAMAGVAVAAAVAEAAVNRAVTGRCWGDCQHGTRCDESTGLCVPEAPTSSAPPPPLTTTATPSEPDESCAGYCLDDERCVIVPNGDVDCVPKKPTPRR